MNNKKYAQKAVLHMEIFGMGPSIEIYKNGCSSQGDVLCTSDDVRGKRPRPKNLPSLSKRVGVSLAGVDLKWQKSLKSHKKKNIYTGCA